MKPLIEFQNVTKTYPTGGGIRDFTFTIYQGEVVVFTGPIGSGKTTILRLIYIVEKPDFGDLIFDQTSIKKLKTKHILFIRQQIGLVHPSVSLLPDRSLLDNLMLPLQISKVPTHEAKKRVSQVIEHYGLVDRADDFCDTFSTGELVRALFARAVVIEPALLLLDEPFANVDTQTQQDLIEKLIEEHSHHCTILISTTNAHLYFPLNPRIVHLEQGRLISETESGSGSILLPLEGN
ncbi:MAG: ATP-binding cassette domain-containing protein [bacterium]|nr:ATP-binding cassette domain-containing protein [bacterium]